MALDPISIALDIRGKIIDHLWPDHLQRDAAKLDIRGKIIDHCMAGLAYQFVAYPILIVCLQKIVSLDIGFGGMRTAEKLAGRAST